MKHLTVSNDYVVRALQRALEIEFSAGRCPTVERITIGAQANENDRTFTMMFRDTSTVVGGTVAEAPVEIGDATTRQRRRFADG